MGKRIYLLKRPVGYVITTGGVCLNDEGKGQMDGSKVVLDIRHGGSAGKTVSAAHGFPRTRQNDSFHPSIGVHLGMSANILPGVGISNVLH